MIDDETRVNIFAGFCAVAFFLSNIVALGIGIPMLLAPQEGNTSGIVCVVVGVLALVGFIFSIYKMTNIKDSAKPLSIVVNVVLIIGLAALIYSAIQAG